MVGLINLMHNTVRWKMQTGPEFGDKREVKVPFYFSTTGQERFLQDNFMNDLPRDPSGEKAETAYNPIPRGHLLLTGISVIPSEITSRSIRTNLNRMQDDGTMKSFSAETYWIPLELDFDVEVFVDSVLDQMKCSQSVIESFYKNNHFEVDVLLTRIPALAYFPEAMQPERNIEFKFDTDKKFSLKFVLNVKTTMPVYNEASMMFSGNRIHGFTYNVQALGPSGIGQSPPTMNGGPSPTGGSGGSTANAQDPPVSSTSIYGPTWPIDPSTPFPPGGGTGY